MKKKDNPLIPINIRSKNELAKRISNKYLSVKDALTLINEVKNNFDDLWKDNLKDSKPEENKWVRNAKGTKLGTLLSLINKRLFAPYDDYLPCNIFGGVSGKNTKSATLHLLGNKRKRTLLKMDLHRFFEQNDYEKVLDFFHKKAGCSLSMSHFFATICCVPLGQKGTMGTKRVLARGFSTSPRLAIWCNLQIFKQIDRKSRSILKGFDPRVSFYVDDIGITASRVNIEKMKEVFYCVKNLLDGSGNYRLELNTKKCFIVDYLNNTYDTNGEYIGKGHFEHLGNELKRNYVTPGIKTMSKLRSYEARLRTLSGQKRKRCLNSIKVRKRYIRYTRN